MCAWPDRPVEPVVEALRIGHLLDQTADELSGGELRRAEVAAVLLLRPRCLLADEPFRGIAPVDCDLLIPVLRRYAAGGGAAIVTGHEAAHMLAVADDVIWMHDGTTEFLGSPEDAERHDRFRPAYLG
jgi:ABC-type lipopolysaccharide export system ATPase subunit